MLRGFKRIHLRPGDSELISFEVPDERLAFWNVDKQAFDVAQGEWNVQVGASSEDIRLKKRILR